MAATLCEVLLFGMSDSVVGVLVPDREVHYDLSYMVVSVALLAPFVGYITAGLASGCIRHLIGRSGS